MTGSLCGLWIDDAGRVHTCRATAAGGRTEQGEIFRPFAWLGAETAHEGVTFEPLQGEGAFRWLAHAESLGAFEVFFKDVREGAAIDVLKPYESQWLLQQRARLYNDLKFSDLRRCQLDIETGASEAACNAAHAANC
ncbi:MAG: hypothetical protein PSW75_05520 [bacterium]|nr:hypothetical protein [bacterium]